MEGMLPAPAIFDLRLSGLDEVDKTNAVVPLWSGCVVDASNTKNQTYQCRSIPLEADGTFQDMIGTTDTNVYQLGCAAEPKAPTNIVFDPSFEFTQQPGVPGSVTRGGCLAPHT